MPIEPRILLPRGCHASREAVDDKDWPESPYPSRELRIFAGLKAWGVIQFATTGR